MFCDESNGRPWRSLAVGVGVNRLALILAAADRDRVVGHRGDPPQLDHPHLRCGPCTLLSASISIGLVLALVLSVISISMLIINQYCHYYDDYRHCNDYYYYHV